MPAFDSGRAIGAVCQLLKNQLGDRTGIHVSIGHPEVAGDGPGTSTRFNLFLYESSFDASMRSRTLDEQRPAPIWMVLRFLLTSFENNRTDNIAAHRQLGDAMRVLQELAYLPITGLTDARDTSALQASPEPLKITFVEASSELLGRVLQGSDERYRFSIAFEVRPVMIATRVAGEDALLVGVRYREPPPPPLPPPPPPPPPPGVDIVLDPNFQPATLSRIDPQVRELGGQLTLHGSGFSDGDFAAIATVDWPIVLDGGHRVVTLSPTARGGVVVAERLSAGAHFLTVVREVPPATRPRRRASNPVAIRLLPTLGSVTLLSTVRDTMTPDAGRAVVTLRLRGALLGTERDDVTVALLASTGTAGSTDDVVDVAATPAQSDRRAVLRNVPAPGGPYRVIVRVNGAQAINSPEINLPVPTP